jgi:hypothetical protein
MRHRWQSLFLVLFLLTACGVKSNPSPPKPRVPMAVSDLQVEHRMEGILLSWMKPPRNEDGTPLTDLKGFTVFRQMEGTLAYPIAFIAADRPDNAEVRDGLYIFQDLGKVGEELRAYQRLTYWVVAQSAPGKLSRPSKEVSLDFIPPASSPHGLTAEGADGFVRLKWQPPKTRTDGQPLDRQPRYTIYRKRGEEPWQLIHPEPVAALSYVDLDVVNGVAYHYTVRAVDNDRPPWREGPAAKEVAAATPRDRTPPTPPPSLRAEVVAGGVRLSWEPSPSKDVAGYHVYRRELAVAAPKRITKEPLSGTSHLDREVRSRTTYGYTVTAQDFSGNESTPSPDVIVTAP